MQRNSFIAIAALLALLLALLFNRYRARVAAHAVISRANEELVALNADATARLDVPERLQLLEDKLISYCRDLLDFTHFAVLVVDPQDKRLDILLTGGFSEDVKNIKLYAATEGNGISGYVAATGKPRYLPDVTREPLYRPGPRMEGIRSELAVPLKTGGRVIGVLSIQSERPDAFDADTRRLLEGVAAQLTKRVSFRRAMRRAVESARHAGALGVKITCGGRLGGSEMGRRERYVEGKLPLHTLDADIDYGLAEAKTTYGILGVKVWLYKGKIESKKEAGRAADAKTG